MTPDPAHIAELIGRQDHCTAEEACRAALIPDPAQPVFNALLGLIGLETGRPDLALEHGGRAVDSAPGYGFAYLIQGRALAMLARHEDARLALERAHWLHPEHPQIAIHLLEETLAAQGAEALRATYARIEQAGGAPEVAEAYARMTAALPPPPPPPVSPVGFRLSSVRAWAEAHGLPVRSAGEVEEIPVQTPPTFTREGLTPAGPVVLVRGNEPYVAELADVTILSRCSLVFTPEGYALSDTATHPLYGGQVKLTFDPLVSSRRGDHVTVDCARHAIEPLEAGVWLSGLVSDAYGHWAPEFLPKLQFLATHPDFARLPIIVDQEMPESHFIYLERLAPNPLVRLPPGGGLRVGRLLVAPTPSFYPSELEPNHTVPAAEIGPLSPRAVAFLRRAGEAVSDDVGGRCFGPKLYLSRRQMSWRRLTNDGEIAAFLEARGFETVLIEELSLDEQIRMFRGAAVIVAPNGSSMLNLMHAPTSVRLLVLSQPEIFNWGTYYGPMHSLGYDMTFVCGDDGLQESKHADYTVPPERLAAALDALT